MSEQTVWDDLRECDFTNPTHAKCALWAIGRGRELEAQLAAKDAEIESLKAHEIAGLQAELVAKDAEIAVARARLGPAGYRLLGELTQLRAEVGRLRAALEQIAGPVEFYDAQGERNMQSLARDALEGE